jgi:hypothetical protein
MIISDHAGSAAAKPSSIAADPLKNDVASKG